MKHYCLRTKSKHKLEDLILLCAECKPVLKSDLSTCRIKNTYSNLIDSKKKELQELNMIQKPEVEEQSEIKVQPEIKVHTNELLKSL